MVSIALSDTEIDKSADVNQDGKINAGDVIYLKWYTANWVGYDL